MQRVETCGEGRRVGTGTRDEDDLERPSLVDRRGVEAVWRAVTLRRGGCRGWRGRGCRACRRCRRCRACRRCGRCRAYRMCCACRDGARRAPPVGRRPRRPARAAGRCTWATQDVRWTAWARTASASETNSGGKTAASSTSPRNDTGVVDDMGANLSRGRAAAGPPRTCGPQPTSIVQHTAVPSIATTPSPRTTPGREGRDRLGPRVRTQGLPRAAIGWAGCRSGPVPGWSDLAHLPCRPHRDASGAVHGIRCSGAGATETDHSEMDTAVARCQAMSSIPPKRHTQHRRPAKRGGPVSSTTRSRGRGGLLLGLLLLYHRDIPSTVAESRRWSVGDLGATPNTRPCSGTSSPTTSSPAKVVKAPTSSPVDGCSSATATCACPMPWPAPRARGTTTASATVRVRRAGRTRVRTVFGAFDVGQGDLVVVPRATTHRWIPKPRPRTRSARSASRRAATSHRRSATSAGTSSSSSAAPLRARPAAAGRPPLAEDVEEDAGAGPVFIRRRGGRGSSSGGVVGSVHVLPFPARRRGLGPVPVPVRLRREGRRAEHGRIHQPPPAHQVLEGWNSSSAARPAQVDYPPSPSPFRSTTPTSTRTRTCSTSMGLRGAQGAKHRQGLGLLLAGGHAHGPQPGAARPRSARSTSTSSQSWSTPPAARAR